MRVINAQSVVPQHRQRIFLVGFKPGRAFEFPEFPAALALLPVLPVDEVRAALLAYRAETEPDISAAHPQPGRPSGARPWGDVIARTFRLKG